MVSEATTLHPRRYTGLPAFRGSILHPVLKFCKNPRLHPASHLFCPCQSGKQKYSVPAVQPHLLCTEPQEQACQKAETSSGAVLGDGAAGQVAWCCAPGPWLGSHRDCTATASSEFVNLQVLDTILQPDPFFSFLKDAFSSPKTQRGRRLYTYCFCMLYSLSYCKSKGKSRTELLFTKPLSAFAASDCPKHEYDRMTVCTATNFFVSAGEAAEYQKRPPAAIARLPSPTDLGNGSHCSAGGAGLSCAGQPIMRKKAQ